MKQPDFLQLTDFIVQSQEQLQAFEQDRQKLVLGQVNQAVYKSLYATIFSVESAANDKNLTGIVAFTGVLKELIQCLDQQDTPYSDEVNALLTASYQALSQQLSALKVKGQDVGDNLPIMQKMLTLIHALEQDGLVETALITPLADNTVSECSDNIDFLQEIKAELILVKTEQMELYSLFVLQMEQHFTRLFALIDQSDDDDQLLMHSREQLQTLAYDASDLGLQALPAYFMRWQGDLLVAHDSQLDEPFSLIAMDPLTHLLPLFGFDLGEIQRMSKQAVTLSAQSYPYETDSQTVEYQPSLIEPDEPFLDNEGEDEIPHDQATAGSFNRLLVASIADLQSLCSQCESLDDPNGALNQIKSTLRFLCELAQKEACQPLMALCQLWIEQIDLTLQQQQTGKGVSWSFMTGYIAKIVKMVPLFSMQEVAQHPLSASDVLVEELTEQLQQAQDSHEDYPTLMTVFDEMLDPSPLPAKESQAFTDDMVLNRVQSDQLFHQVNELNQRMGYLSILEDSLSQADQGRDSLAKAHQQCQKIHQLLRKSTTQLQQSLQTIRQQPIQRLFDTLTEKLEQWAEQQHKQVRLSLPDMDQGIDIQWIDALQPCLLALVKNALEHGIETPSIRQRLDKSVQGHIQIRLSMEHGLFRLEVEDDGHGLYLEKIKQKALAQNLIGSTKMAQLTQLEIYLLIFEAGLSTVSDEDLGAERGMGLVFVKEAVTQLTGHLQVSTQPGRFSLIQISIPMIPMRLNTVRVKVDADTYFIAYDAVQKILDIDDEETLLLQEKDEILWQGEALNLCYLTSSSVGLGGMKVSVLVLRVGQKRIGLVVDQVEAGETVTLAPPRQKSRLFTSVWMKNGQLGRLINLAELPCQAVNG